MMENNKGKKAAYFTLGCKLNFAETSSIGQELKAAGIRTVRQGEIADVCVINTCSVTEVADQKCRQAIHRLVRNHPGALVVVTGCYAQLNPEQVGHIDGVHLVLGTEQKGHIAEYVLDYLERMPEERCVLPLLSEVVRTADIRTFVPSCSCGDRTRYFLKVQDGCDYYCTYCTIPKARGRSRNGSIASLVEQARGVAARGGHEIVITGVNIGDFGKSTGERFIDLLGALDAVEGIDRYRISSIEPDLLTDDVITFCARSRAFMPHFHIPLQCGSDEVLRLMHRHYDTALFEEKITRIRSLMPDAFIGVDVIVGSRGETEGLFRQSLSFMQRIPVSQYHVFSYSERPGTMALKIPHVVRTEEKHARSQKVIALSERLLTSFYERFVGQVRPVLIEHSRKAGCVHGFTDNYIRVEIPCGQTMPDNVILPVRLGNWNATHDALMGTVVQCGCKHGDDE
ncbi:MAG: tRNA (N(6)-L-threonylcarbamoyladenosine(37)-C(2))-methylthiotransferase MtaB [Prevotellaceae bacterium]|nr:tRNA (N(6)-L-threonylcarbamoyladenosine(37)-C(2))-methylthiotransferase MtaB [Prevotellaceae bacterium]MDY6098858.1 tRNA (N(6)-L-threonylcarbamoyladenosine(37)-C(2))-methylthiotransferase MtaB [Bacteroidaceae bacterium]